MTTPWHSDPQLSIARERALASDWSGVRELLATAAVESSPAEAKLLLAEAELRLGEARLAGNQLRPIADSLERSGDRAALGRAMNLLGAALFELGELDDAESAFGRALQVASQDDDAVLIARATNNLGAIANVRGQRESALALYQIAVPA
ncbi:MAG: tetratricopeptide repeat protein [Gemmatimonadaceae bacterium]